MTDEKPTTHELIYTCYLCQIIVEKWWSSRSATWHVNVIIKDVRPAMEIVLDADNVDEFTAALSRARDKAREMIATLAAETTGHAAIAIELDSNA
jgi:hypothetical protein